MDAITACVVGGVSMSGGVGKPWGVDGTMVGMLCNFLVFTACTKAYQRYDVQKIRVWK